MCTNYSTRRQQGAANPPDATLLCYLPIHSEVRRLGARKVHGGAGADVLRPQPRRQSAEGAHPRGRRRRQRRTGRLPARTFPDAILLPARRSRAVRSRRTDSRPHDRTNSSAAAKKHGVVLVASLFEKRAPGVYHNTAAIFDRDGTLRGIYRKMHIPDDPLYYEKFYFTPGDLGFRAFDTDAGKIGTLVCWDQWYPGRRSPDRPAGRDTDLSTRLPSAGILPRKPSSAKRNTMPGARFSAPTPSPTACTSESSIASALKRATCAATKRRPATALNSGADRSSADPFGRVLAQRLARQGRNPDGRGRPEHARRHSPQLALPARPPHRQLRAHHQPADRLTWPAQSERSSNTLSPVPGPARMPAEWEPHASTWLAWPHFRGDWPGKFEPIPWVYAEIIRNLSRHERVDLIVNDAASEKGAPQDAATRERPEQKRPLPSLAHRPRLDPRLAAALRRARAPAAGVTHDPA